MITQEVVQETWERIQNDDYHLIFSTYPDPYQYATEFTPDDWSLVLSVIGQDFLNTPFDDWGHSERIQMETVVDLCANVLDI